MAAMVVTAAAAAPWAPACAQGIEDGSVRKDSGPARKDDTALDGWPRVLIALGVVVLLIFLARYLIRRAGKTAGRTGQRGPVQTLWRTNLSIKHQLFLVRLGRRLLLVGSAGGGLTTLCELSDPQEIAEALSAVDQGLGDSFISELDRQARQYPTAPQTPPDQPAAGRQAGAGVRELTDKIRARTDQQEQENG
jgi:flagellar biogenesis protein FliO